jgi:hypothetical protein
MKSNKQYIYEAMQKVSGLDAQSPNRIIYRGKVTADQYAELVFNVAMNILREEMEKEMEDLLDWFRELPPDGKYRAYYLDGRFEGMREKPPKALIEEFRNHRHENT